MGSCGSPRLKKRAERAGFTLLEMMVVVALIAAVVSVITPRIGTQNNQMKAALRRFSVLSRQIQAMAKMQNATYRLAIDLGDAQNPLGKRQQKYWLEKTTRHVALASDGSSNLKEIKKDLEEKSENLDGFEMDGSILKGEQALPGELLFSSVEFTNQDKPAESGVVYIHYFPNGLLDEAALHIQIGDSKAPGELQQWTLALHPLTGRVEITPNFMALKDVQDQ